jgi:hypothetical protein
VSVADNSLEAAVDWWRFPLGDLCFPFAVRGNGRSFQIGRVRCSSTGPSVPIPLKSQPPASLTARPFGRSLPENGVVSVDPRGRLMMYVMYLVVGVAAVGLIYLVIRDALDRRRVAVKRRKGR